MAGCASSGAGDDEVCRYLDGRDSGSPASFARVRYLSQQFVEDLCSSGGPTDGLIAEIERVVFEAHAHEARDGALDFDELRERRTHRFRQARAREAEAILQISQRISEEFETERLAEPLARQVEQKKKQIAGYRADLGKLVIGGSDAQLKRHQELQAAAQVLRKKTESYKQQRRTFEGLRDEVNSMRATIAPEMLRQSKARHAGSGMSAEQWEEFLLDYSGPVDERLTDYVKWVDREIAALEGSGPEAKSERGPYVTQRGSQQCKACDAEGRNRPAGRAIEREQACSGPVFGAIPSHWTGGGRALDAGGPTDGRQRRDGTAAGIATGTQRGL